MRLKSVLKLTNFWSNADETHSRVATQYTFRDNANTARSPNNSTIQLALANGGNPPQKNVAYEGHLVVSEDTPFDLFASKLRLSN